jgi:Rrf2 family nitric oxide-sensitive transcriptional repressor
MHITTKTDYCLRVLIYLQENTGKTKIQQIAKKYKISKNHLSIAVNKLSGLGYVISTPGPKGGIEFNPEMADRTIAELTTSLEDLNLVECFETKTNSCILSSKCRLQHMLKKATRAFIDELSTYKIKDLV